MASQSRNAVLGTRSSPSVLRGGRQAELGTPLEVLAGPPAGHGRQIVGAGHRGGGTGPGPGLGEALAVPLEPEHAHAEDAGVGEFVLEAFGDGAEVLAEHDRAVALALERDQAEQVGLREGEVGAVLGLHPVRHDPEAAKAERVVDADAAGVAHGGAQHFEEGGESVAAQAARREGGEAPALAFRGQQVGGRADGEADECFLLARPAMAAAGIRADGEVGDDADGHAGLLGGALGFAKALVGAPLGVGVEGDLVRVLAGEVGDGRAARIAKFGRPVAPVPMAFGELGGVKGFEAGVGLERVAHAGAELVEPAPVGEALELLAQGVQAPPSRLRPVHEVALRGVQRRWARAGR